MLKLVSKKHPIAYAGQTIHFPVIGNATFNEDGSLDVDDGKVDDFIDLTKPSFDFQPKVGSGRKKKELTPEELAAEIIEKENEGIRETLDASSFEQLIELAKESKIPKESLASMTDKKLRKLLFKELTKKE